MHIVDSSIQPYCEVDASYLIHPDSKGHTGYTIGLHPNGTFYNRSAKQTLVSTSSTHAEMRALYTLVKDILFIIYICSEVNISVKEAALFSLLLIYILYIDLIHNVTHNTYTHVHSQL